MRHCNGATCRCPAHFVVMSGRCQCDCAACNERRAFETGVRAMAALVEGWFEGENSNHKAKVERLMASIGVGP